MKNTILIILCAVLLLSACKKENSAPNTPAIPLIPEQETNQAVTGVTEVKNDIIYTQIDRELSYNKFITIDADNNGKNDFYFTSVLIGHNNQSHMYLLASAVSTSGAKLMFDNREELVIGMWGKPVDAGTPIKPLPPNNTAWENFMVKGMLLDVIDNFPTNTFNGPWVEKADKYLPMQIVINGQIHYGWISVTHAVNESRMRIVGFAYNKVAGEVITAGQKE